MARQLNGFLGNFLSITDLTAKYPPEEYTGCSANVGVSAPYRKAWCDGVQWSGLTSSEIETIVNVTVSNSTITTEALPSTVFPDEAVRLTASGCACATPCYITRIQCVVGTSIALVVYDNPAASSGTQLYSGTLSAGEEAVLSSDKVRAINGVRLAFIGTATFDTYINTEVA